MTGIYCVVGATRGTGLEITRQLLQQGNAVRVIARYPEKAKALLGNGTDIRAGDVTVPGSLGAALGADCQAIFFAVDITEGIAGRAFFGSSSKIRDVTYQGFVNVIEEAKAHGFIGRVVLLSGMGCDRWSLPSMMLNLIKGNLQKNMVDREQYLAACGLDFTVCRAAVLTDEPAWQQKLKITKPVHSLSVRRKVSRADYARVLIAAATHTATSRRVLDVFAGAGPASSENDLVRQLGAQS